MKISLLAILLFFMPSLWAQQESTTPNPQQKERITYSQIDFSFPLRGPDDSEDSEGSSWSILDGASVRGGFGIVPAPWLMAGGNLGLDWIDHNGMFAMPVFASLRIAPKIGNDFRIVAEPGFGKAFAFAPQHLSGTFRKISLGVCDGNSAFTLYFEGNEYNYETGYKTHQIIRSFCIGLNYFFGREPDSEPQNPNEKKN